MKDGNAQGLFLFVVVECIVLCGNAVSNVSNFVK